MIVSCESNEYWYSKSTPKVKNFKIVKRLPKSVTFSTDFSRSKLISAEDGKTVIYEGLVVARYRVHIENMFFTSKLAMILTSILKNVLYINKIGS